MRLFRRNRAEPRSPERAAALSSWASSRGWQYVDAFPPTRSVLLARGQRNAIYDLVTGPLVPGLDCQLFTFDWITSMVDNYGNREYHHHPSLAVRAVFPRTLALRYLSVEPGHAGALGHVRDKLFGLRHHGSREIAVSGLPDDFHVFVLEHDDDELAQRILSPSVVALIAGDASGPDRHPLAFQVSGSEAMVLAAGVALAPDQVETAEWLVTRAAPFLVEMSRAAAAGPAPAASFVGPLVEPERPGQKAPPTDTTTEPVAPVTKTTVTTTTKVSANLKVNVPTQYSERAQTALTEWLAGRGMAVAIDAEPAGANTALTFKSDAGAGPDFADPAVQAELQRVLIAVLTGQR